MIRNILKTFLILGLMSGLLIMLGGLIGGMSGLKIALFMACIMNGIAYFFSDKIVLSLYNAQPLQRNTHGYIYRIVEELCATMQLPAPKLWIIQNSMANAFATGRNPNHASIAVTTGILQILQTTELRAVLAHELAHVKNRDILITTIAATLAAAVGYIAHRLKWIALWGYGFRNNNDKRTANPFVLMAAGILMPFAALLLQLSLSRSREYLADETGAHYCKDPLALASALEKLHQKVSHTHPAQETNEQHQATSALFIVHPFKPKGSISELLSTHPPVEKRIARLRTLYEKMFSVR